MKPRLGAAMLKRTRDVNMPWADFGLILCTKLGIKFISLKRQRNVDVYDATAKQAAAAAKKATDDAQ